MQVIALLKSKILGWGLQTEGQAHYAVFVEIYSGFWITNGVRLLRWSPEREIMI